MKLQVRRVMLFARNMKVMTRFYEEQLGLKVLERSPGFVDFDAGSCRISLHRAGASTSNRTKICFFAKDVSQVRAELIKLGVPMGKESASGKLPTFCDAKDPEGNILQFSDRP